MCDGQQRAVRRNLIAQAALVWGNVRDLQAFIDSGRVDGQASGERRPVAMSPEVDRYAYALRHAGRFLMPDEVERWYAEEARELAARPEVPGPATSDPDAPAIAATAAF